MYNKLIKKNKLFKIFTFILPKKKTSTKSCYYLCKYFINKTPYGQLSTFIQEINRILNFFILNSKNKKLLFLCSNKIFLLDFINLKKKSIIQSLLKDSFFFNDKFQITEFSFIIMYNMNYTKKLTSFIKQKKLPTIGFIDFNNQANLTDYTLLLESKFFSSIYLFHYLLKKVIYHVKI